MKTVAIIQARMGSSRLPGKVLRRVGSQAVLTHVLTRAKAIPGVHEVHVTTTPQRADDAIAARCRGAGVGWTRGQVPMANGKNDVLAGYVAAAKATGADVIVRLTADCPLLDPAVAGRVLHDVVVNRADYASNVNPPTLYDGCDVEAFTWHTLWSADKHAGPTEREHVTTWMRRHAESRYNYAEDSGDWSGIKLSVDTLKDLERVRRVWKLLPQPFGWRDVVRAYRQAYPPKILARARRIYGKGSPQVDEYLRGAYVAALDQRLPASASRISVIGYEDVAELGHGISDDDVAALRDLLNSPVSR